MIQLIYNALCQEEDKFECMKFLLERLPDAKNFIDNKKLLFKAKNASETRLLLDHGANVNIKDKYGLTPLHRAKTEEQTRLLLDHGADINAKNGWGITPLHQPNTEAQTKLLLEAGADVNVKDYFGRTPLVYTSSIQVLKLLVEAGAVVTAECIDIALSEHERKFLQEVMDKEKEN